MCSLSLAVMLDLKLFKDAAPQLMHNYHTATLTNIGFGKKKKKKEKSDRVLISVTAKRRKRNLYASCVLFDRMLHFSQGKKSIFMSAKKG